MLTTTVRIGNGQKAQLTLDEEYLEEEDFGGRQQFQEYI
jgi:hypothetical protein